MNEAEIRKRYQREDESDPRGTNVGAMDKFIEMLYLHEKSNDPRIKNIAENFEYIETIAPNFLIFEGKKSFFMYNAKAYQIAKDVDMLVTVHEFGHAILSIMNNTKIPQDYAEIIERAKQYALSPENKENFKTYIQYISGKTDETEKRTEAERGPVSDIISSVFQRPGLRIGNADNVCIFPSSHPREYYYDEKKNEPNLKNIFDEDFANYYTLKVNNCKQEIETIRNLFGDEFVQTLEEELTKASEKLVKVKESKAPKEPNIMEQIKSTVVFTRQGELEEIKENVKEEIKSEDKTIEEREEK